MVSTQLAQIAKNVLGEGALGSPLREICTMGSERGDEYKKPCSLGEGTGPKGSDDSEAPQRATASRLVPTHQCDVPEGEGLRRFGYSRDKRTDCVQVVIALIVTPEGFPLGYEALPGNTADSSTLGQMLEKIEAQYGRASRLWLMDRGIPTEAVLEQMRQADPPVHYLVGTPKGRLTRLEARLAEKSWQQVREGVAVKLIDEDDELYVLARSAARISKERGMRQRRLKKLWRRLHELKAQRLAYAPLLLKLGAAKAKAGEAWKLVEICLPEPPASLAQRKQPVSFEFTLNKQRLRQRRAREGRYSRCGPI